MPMILNSQYWSETKDFEQSLMNRFGSQNPRLPTQENTMTAQFAEDRACLATSGEIVPIGLGMDVGEPSSASMAFNTQFHLGSY